MPFDTEAYRQQLAARLSAPAYEHCVRVAEESARIAATYAVDPELAYLAGLLHDWDRQVGAAELVERARSAGIPVTEVDLAVPYLLHAKTAAAELAGKFPSLPSEVISAVARHTVGSADMTELDQVVFLGDMLEPGRAWPGIEKLRELVGTVSLGDLFASAYRNSVAHLVLCGKRIHPDTLEVLNSLADEACDE